MITRFTPRLTAPPRCIIAHACEMVFCATRRPHDVDWRHTAWCVERGVLPRLIEDEIPPPDTTGYRPPAAMQVIYDKETNRSKGFGFITFAHESVAQAAMGAYRNAAAVAAAATAAHIFEGTPSGVNCWE
jgi:hypothetical protein